jgi:oligopeptide transport system ATP-binding protein
MLHRRASTPQHPGEAVHAGSTLMSMVQYRKLARHSCSLHHRFIASAGVAIFTVMYDTMKGTRTGGETTPEPEAPTRPTLVEVHGVSMRFPIRRGIFSKISGHVQAVNDVSFCIHQGEILGLVGESGCGKSTLGRIILSLLKPTAGRVTFDGVDVTQLKGPALKAFRKRAQIIFQDPHASLNPRMSVGSAIREPLTVHDIIPVKECDARVAELLDVVGLNSFHMRRYPHEFSSGQRQRIGIARSLAVEPDFILCDEPVSALDVSIQAQILNLLMDLRRSFGLSYLFISHDLAVVRHISDRIAVMYLGSIVELGRADRVMHEPLHPYTAALILAAPVPDPTRRRERILLEGDVPIPVDIPDGCPFHTRCPQRLPDCEHIVPRMADIGDGHLVRCLLYDQCRPAA